MDTAEESFRESIRRAEGEVAAIRETLDTERKQVAETEAYLKRAETTVAEKRQDLANYRKEHGIE